MPTLVQVEVAAEPEDDASETILFDESTLLDCPTPTGQKKASSGLVGQADNPKHSEVEFDINDSTNFLSKSLLIEGLSPLQLQLPGPVVNRHQGAGSKQSSDGPSSGHQLNPRPRPSMNRYCMKYESYVKDTIGKFIARHPGKLRDYRTMSTDEKREERERVAALLARLRIGKMVERPTNLEYELDISHFSTDEPDSTFHCAGDDSMSPVQNPPSRNRTIEKLANENRQSTSVHRFPSSEFAYADTSTLLLSPQSASSRLEYSSKPLRRTAPNASILRPGSIESIASVENVRRAQHSASSASNVFDSPERRFSNAQKRLASTSGKRGADLARFRHDDDDSPQLPNSNRHSDDLSAPYRQLEMLSILPSPSPDRGEIFAASQSPISQRMTCPSSDSDSSASWGAEDFPVFEDDATTCLYRRESIYSYGSSMGKQKREKLGFSGMRPQLREIPANIAMKEGATFHLAPLDTKRNEQSRHRLDDDSETRSRQLVDFPDPLARYTSREKDLLTNVFQWIQQLDQGRDDEHHCPAGVIFSLSEQQIVHVTLKIVLGDKKDDLEASGNGQLAGQTIIVARAKEDLEKWESAFRENTGCSVLNHATLPNCDRKSPSTAKRCALFDVILTTFDAIKSPDIATPVDDLGYAIPNKDARSQGWYSSRTASQSSVGPQKCKQFSILHQVQFRRIIFADVLGRKSFLAKKNTARASAAVALQGRTR
jgi:hypothetical protein